MKTYSFEDGKYEFDRDDQGRIVAARRGGESWGNDGYGPFAFARAFHAALDRIDELEAPINMVLYCPNCGMQHVDKPDDRCKMGGGCDESGRCYAESQGVPERCERWTNPPHRSHLCHACGTIWRPADVPTNGVAELKTQGKAGTWPVHADEVVAQPASAMNDYTAKQVAAALAEIAAANARVEGMKAKNLERQEQGYALAYDEDAFFAEAQSLSNLADYLRQL